MNPAPSRASVPPREGSSPPGRRYGRFLPVLEGGEILDFGLKETELRRASALARWMGVSECYLKLETPHPTRTVKDRITEIVFSYFQAHGIRRYVHCSAGNAGTSLVWGAERCPRPFEFESFIPQSQLRYHNFKKGPGLTVVLVEGAGYEEAKQYCSWYAKEVVHQPDYMSFRSDLRRQANKVPYLEAFEQLGREKADIDYVCQAISDGGGIGGADLAASDALAEGWLPRRPAFVATQPAAANPVVRCFRGGFATYDPSCTLGELGDSLAFAIRRRNASGYYSSLYELLKRGGFALDAAEEEIGTARRALLDLESVEAGYTACTSLAAIRKENLATGAFRGKKLLVMITGADRSTEVLPAIDRVIPEAEWKRVIGTS
jgi:threonine synthase